MQATIENLTKNNEPFEALAKYTEHKEKLCWELRQKEKNLVRIFRTHKKRLEQTLKTLSAIPLEMQSPTTRFWLREKLKQTDCALEVLEKEMAEVV
jgi:hypothetical protein